MQRLLPLIALLLLASATAQGRLNPPNYYLSQLPQLRPGDVLQGELTPEDGQNFKDGSYLDLYAMYGEEGEDVTLLASSLEFDIYLSLFGPDGSFLGGIDDSLYGTDAELLVTLPENGRYLVVVSGYSQYDLGRYSLSRSESLPASAAEVTELMIPGTTSSTFDAAATMEMPYYGAPSMAFTFELAEPIALSISVQAAEFDTFVMVTDEAGNVIAENDDEDYSAASGWNTDSKAFAEFAPGVHYVYVTSLYGEPLGDFTITTRRFAPID